MPNKKTTLMELLLDTSLSCVSFGKTVPAQNVLVLAPHQDDEVLGCGGIILKYLEQEVKVTIVYLTDGRNGIREGAADIREKEALAAWSKYTGINQIFCRYADSRLVDHEDDAIVFLHNVLEELNPNVIFTPWIFDRHNDHTSTSRYLATALQNLEKQHYIIASYEVAFPLCANHTVNITKQWNKKLELLDAYESQKHLNIKEFNTSLNNYRAQLTRLRSVKVAESFYVADSIIYQNFVKACISDKQSFGRSS